MARLPSWVLWRVAVALEVAVVELVPAFGLRPDGTPIEVKRSRRS